MRRGNCYPSTRGTPAAHRTFRGLMFSKTSGQLLREHARNPCHLDLHPHTRRKEMFMRQDCCARTPQAHLNLSPCANRHVHATTLLRSHAVSTLGSHSVRKETCSIEKTAAFRAQRAMFRQNDCCVLTLRAHLDLDPCAKRHVRSKRLLPSRAAPKIDDFYWRTPDSVSTVKRAHVPFAIGNP